MADAANASMFAPKAPGFMRAPQHTYQALRAGGAIHHDAESGVYFVLSYAAAEEVMRSPRRFSSQVDRATMRAGGLPAEVIEIRKRGWPLALTLSHNDGPSHAAFRKLTVPFFMPKALDRLQPFIAERSAELWASIARAGEIDFVTDYAVPLPIAVIGEHLGMRHHGDETLKRWSDAFADEIGFLTSDDRAVEIAHQTLACHRAMKVLCDERRGGTGEDVITALANATVDGRALEVPELLSILTQLLVAGNETTTATLAFAALRLATAPELFARLRDHRERIAPFVEEVLRLDSPIQGQFRRTVGDEVIAGTPIPAGSLLHVRFASANRDETVWGVDDGKVHLDRRPPRPHMAFGSGMHFCIGAALSRLELQIALNQLLDRFRGVELVGDVNDLPFRTHFHHRGLLSLPLRFIT
jgi:cytochrome P450